MEVTKFETNYMGVINLPGAPTLQRNWYRCIPTVDVGTNAENRQYMNIKTLKCHADLFFTWAPATNQPRDYTINVFVLTAKKHSQYAAEGYDDGAFAVWNKLLMSDGVTTEYFHQVGTEPSAFLQATMPFNHSTVNVLKHKSFRMVKPIGNYVTTDPAGVIGTPENLVTYGWNPANESGNPAALSRASGVTQMFSAAHRMRISIPLPAVLRYQLEADNAGVNGRLPQNFAPFLGCTIRNNQNGRYGQDSEVFMTMRLSMSWKDL